MWSIVFFRGQQLLITSFLEFNHISFAISSCSHNLIKVPSACNLNKGLLEYLCDNFEGEIHLSLGMTTYNEEEQIVQFFESKGRNKDLVIYNCTSGYPVPFEDICLHDPFLSTFGLKYKEKEVLDIEEVQRNKLKKYQIKW